MPNVRRLLAASGLATLVLLTGCSKVAHMAGPRSGAIDIRSSP